MLAKSPSRSSVNADANNKHTKFPSGNSTVFPRPKPPGKQVTEPEIDPVWWNGKDWDVAPHQEGNWMRIYPFEYEAKVNINSFIGCS